MSLKFFSNLLCKCLTRKNATMPCLLPVQYIQFQTSPLLILHHDIIHILTLTSKVYLPKDHKWFYPDSVFGCRKFYPSCTTDVS